LDKLVLLNICFAPQSSSEAVPISIYDMVKQSRVCPKSLNVDGIHQTFNQKGQNQMVLLEFSMTPSTKEESKSQFVARILDVIDESGLTYQLTPMGTIIEGDWAEVMAVVTDCFKALEVDCPRLSSQIKIDYRAGTNSRMTSKVEAVETILGRKLST